MRYVQGEGETEARVAEGVRCIMNSAVCGLWRTESVYIPDSVEYIADRAFEDMRRLKRLCLPGSSMFVMYETPSPD